MIKRGKRNNFRVCSGPHLTGSTSGSNIDGAIASCYRKFGHKYLYSELHNKQFKNSDEASDALAERGYGTEHFSRDSVASNGALPHQIEQARFDALYRFFKHTTRLVMRGGYNVNTPLHVQKARLKELAKSVGIFHHCTKLFNSDYPIAFKKFTCKKCGEIQKGIWPYRGISVCWKCNERICWRCEEHNS